MYCRKQRIFHSLSSVNAKVLSNDIHFMTLIIKVLFHLLYFWPIRVTHVVTFSTISHNFPVIFDMINYSLS